jgi:hypothetical protein
MYFDFVVKRTRASVNPASGPQFTCFTGPKVQILTQQEKHLTRQEKSSVAESRGHHRMSTHQGSASCLLSQHPCMTLPAAFLLAWSGLMQRLRSLLSYCGRHGGAR